MELDEAEEYLINEAQKRIQTNWRTGFKRLPPGINQRGIIVVGYRMMEWLKDSWNENLFKLLPLKEERTYV